MIIARLLTTKPFLMYMPLILTLPCIEVHEELSKKYTECLFIILINELYICKMDKMSSCIECMINIIHE